MTIADGYQGRQLIKVFVAFPKNATVFNQLPNSDVEAQLDGAADF